MPNTIDTNNTIQLEAEITKHEKEKQRFLSDTESYLNGAVVKLQEYKRGHEKTMGEQTYYVRKRGVDGYETHDLSVSVHSDTNQAMGAIALWVDINGAEIVIGHKNYFMLYKPEGGYVDPDLTGDDKEKRKQSATQRKREGEYPEDGKSFLLTTMLGRRAAREYIEKLLKATKSINFQTG